MIFLKTGKDMFLIYEVTQSVVPLGLDVYHLKQLKYNILPKCHSPLQVCMCGSSSEEHHEYTTYDVSKIVSNIMQISYRYRED